jgi:hypothetical protein
MRPWLQSFAASWHTFINLIISYKYESKYRLQKSKESINSCFGVQISNMNIVRKIDKNARMSKS